MNNKSNSSLLKHAAVALLVTAMRVAASTVVGDSFDWGSNIGSDPNLSWTMTSSLAIVSDNVAGGINNGNALAVPSSAWFWTFGSGLSFASQSLTSGESLTLSLTVRYTGVPSSDGAGLRLGLGNDSGTYDFTLGTGSTPGEGIGEAGADSLSSFQSFPTSGTAVAIDDITPHQISVTVTRAASEIDFSAALDGVTDYIGKDTSSALTTFSTLGVGTGQGGSGYLVDNILMSTAAPEPAPCLLFGCGMGLLMMLRRRI